MKKKQKKNEFSSDFEPNDLDLNEENSKEQEEGDAIPQTPLTKAERKMIKNTKRKGEDRSKLDHYDKSDLAEARRYAKNHKLKVLFVALTVFLLLAVITFLVVFAIIKLNSGPSKNDYLVSVGDEEPYELDYDEYNEYGQFYFDLKSIAKYAGLEVGEDFTKGVIFFLCEDDTYVILENGKSVANVNGTYVEVGGTVHLIAAKGEEKSKCLIPFTFIQKLFSHKADKNSAGMAVYLYKDNEVVIHRFSYPDGSNPPISFSADCFSPASDDFFASFPTNHVDKTTASALKASKLVLVNKSHPLDEEAITSEGLVSLSSLGCPVTDPIRGSNDFFDPIAALALIAMINDANEHLEGDDKILVSSAFRSYKYQEGLHNVYVEKYMSKGMSEIEAIQKASEFSAQPGKSEHHTGLCVDIVNEGSADKELTESFKNTAAFKWLSNNAHKYGFILRYPEGKTDITKYSYEPWHYRFVGIYAASAIYNTGFTLEEFLVDLD